MVIGRYRCRQEDDGYVVGHGHGIIVIVVLDAGAGDADLGAFFEVKIVSSESDLYERSSGKYGMNDWLPRRSKGLPDGTMGSSQDTSS